jgi:AraC-like DNA-binding protein
MLGDGEETHRPVCTAATAVPRERIDIVSTDVVHPRERLTYWRETVTSAVFGISVEAAPESFSARMSARSYGPFRFAISESTGYALSRSAREIARTSSDHYSIYLQLSGQTTSVLDEQIVSLTANDIGLYDGRVPLKGMHGGRRAIAVVPRAMLNVRAPWLRKHPPRKLASSSFVKLARRHLLQLTAVGAEVSESEAALLTENLCNLIALASARDIEPGRLEPNLQIEAILVFCRQNLHEPDLSPQCVADRFRISVRTLHARFSQVGQTFGRWLLEARLDACGTALRDAHQRNLNISEIAYRTGFNDLSHFNKAFRSRFGMTPRDWRNAGAPN